MRVAILGNSGSGKTTLSEGLASRHGLARLDLDAVAWEPGRVAVPRSAADAAADVVAFCETHPRWVVEGCYAGLVEVALRYGPTLVFLDPGVEACRANCRERPWEPHKYRSKAEQDERLEFLLSWVKDYYTREGEMSLVAHQALFDRYDGPKRKMVRRASPEWMDRFDALEAGGGGPSESESCP